MNATRANCYIMSQSRTFAVALRVMEYRSSIRHTAPHVLLVLLCTMDPNYYKCGMSAMPP